MALRRLNWSLIVVGRWNRSILTPGGIAKRIFGLGDLEQMKVAVPMDGVSPYQVKHPTNNIIVSTEESRLRIQLDKCDYETLGYAMKAGWNALNSLPETPVLAAGFNIEFHSSESIPSLAQMIQTPADACLAKFNRGESEILAMSMSRFIRFRNGELRVILSEKEGGSKLRCNFHRSSSDVGDLKEWLQIPTDEIRDAVGNLLESLDLEIEEITNDAD